MYVLLGRGVDCSGGRSYANDQCGCADGGWFDEVCSENSNLSWLQNSSPQRFVSSDSVLWDVLIGRSQRRGLSKLYSPRRRIVPKTTRHDKRARNALLPSVDSMSTMSRLVTSRRYLHIK